MAINILNKMPMMRFYTCHNNSHFCHWDLESLTNFGILSKPWNIFPLPFFILFLTVPNICWFLTKKINLRLQSFILDKNPSIKRKLLLTTISISRVVLYFNYLVSQIFQFYRRLKNDWDIKMIYRMQYKIIILIVVVKTTSVLLFSKYFLWKFYYDNFPILFLNAFRVLRKRSFPRNYSLLWYFCFIKNGKHVNFHHV